MKCPHCAVTIHVSFTQNQLGEAVRGSRTEVFWVAKHANCPNCSKKIIWMVECTPISDYVGRSVPGSPIAETMVWPQSSERPLSPVVPKEIAEDFTEAVRVLPLSPQASAALTRRCLQHVLREYGGTTKKDLADQIDEVMANGHISPSLADQLDAVRVIGNFAAHPLKSKSSGTILPVEAHEAEWNLDVLELCFDHYFVKPAIAVVRKAALNKKLAEGGKPVLP